MIGFIGTSLQLQSIMTAHNQCLCMICSICYWTMSVFSSILMNDEVRISAHTLNSLNDVCLMNRHFLSAWPLISASSYPWKLVGACMYPCKSFVGTKTCLWECWLLSNRGPTVDCITLRICLPKRCLANGHIPSQYIWEGEWSVD
jgi:hypothetical protein